MGVYLNSKNPFGQFCDEAAADYFVDKSQILAELLPIVAAGSPLEKKRNAGGRTNKYVCVTRPRRFGKTLIASMIASFFSRGVNSRDIFQRLQAGDVQDFDSHINKHNVIYISFHEIPYNCTSYRQYIDRIQKRLVNDLKKEYADLEFEDGEPVWDMLNLVYETKEDARFIFVLDEWDYIFHRNFVSQQDQYEYLDFLSNLLKGKPYVELAYMTGILPIAKYSSGSELNMFYEYTLATREKYSAYFGFTDEEVDELYERYLQLCPSPNVTREGLKIWYDGYQTVSGRRIYNPRSVVGALSDNQLGSYWTSAGPYDEIFYYVKNNVGQVRDDLALMVSGTPVCASVQEYAAVSMRLSTRDEIFSAMVVYGFLSYERGYVSIPNKELMDQFVNMIRQEPSLGYVHRLAKESEKMLNATKAGDTKTMAEILEYAHHTESPLLFYNNEAELTLVVNMVYLAARDIYHIEREDQVGVGYADFIFYPLNKADDCIILELKVGHTAKEAVRQIKERKYALKFEGKIGEKPEYTGRILAVGIAYQKEKKEGGSLKEHSCVVEILRY